MSRLWSQGHFDELSPECQKCQHRKTVSVHMDGNHTYACGKYPLKIGEDCPKYEPKPPTSDGDKED